MESGTVVGNRVFIAENATVIGDVSLGDDVSVWFGAVVRGDRDTITVGAGSNIQDNAVVHTTPDFPATIGAEVSVGHAAILHGCTIRDRVLVGMGAVVLNGAVVGEGSIIGAGAVVTEGKDIPSNSLILGVPGKVVRETTPEQQESILHNAQEYVKLAGRYRHD
ncbi:gamma carbonic anhydrase family protein [Methanoculleus sp. FWC-SCC3]|uniref:Gamma carbonic anhydrase family protein n=1 Tax=Methanoculleus methanifontis TaxID=2584086 RepID=A0ABT8M4K8_9EURY|nr:gamma carbonic anhydrase family protein [Methanoculleus sp. FWC-SCC3]MDN7013527.1 gamma carbonic anhydrase family protein [Methanoculleus sp. FWC-SCC3]